MFETSNDLLNIVIAAAVAVFTVFICWIMYYFISILRTVKKSVNEIKTKIEALDVILNSLKEKISHSSNYLGLLVKSVISLLEFFRERKDKKSNPVKKK